MASGEKTSANVPPVFPPIGFVDQQGAARRLGVNPRTLREWIKDGLLSYRGTLTIAPKGVRRRIFRVTTLDEARRRMLEAVAARATLPEGFVDRDEAARILGIVPDTLALWHTNGRLRCGVNVKNASGKRCKIYPRAKLQQLLAKMAADTAARATLPQGFVDIEGVCEMFGITRAAWIIWKRQGKVPRGKNWRSATQTYCKIYPVEELRRVIRELRGPDKVFQLGGRIGAGFHIPDGWIQLREACAMFGVDPNTFVRWEREGLITCGRNETGRRIKIYPRAELERLLEENGRFAPPYPDPKQAGSWRVPLAGHDMQRREAIIDAQDLPVVEGRRWHYTASAGEGHGRVATFNRVGESSLHHLIMGVQGRVNGQDVLVSHRNGDPLDCRRANLIVRTRSESGANMRKARSFCGRPCTSRFKGVCWAKGREKWVAYIKKDQVSRTLGRFHDELAAAQAYDEAASELFGEHARLNFPDGLDAWLEVEAARAELAERGERAQAA
jgi:predicted site-specific integrase-resolvase